MNLLPDIDEKATIANVRNFFDKDFPSLQNMAHISNDDIETHTTVNIPLDDKLTARAYANDLLGSVLDSCRSIRQPNREILEQRYFKNMSWLVISQRSGYSIRRCHQIINEAFL